MRTTGLLFALAAVIGVPGIGSTTRRRRPSRSAEGRRDARRDGRPGGRGRVTLRTASGVELKLPTQAIAAREVVGARRASRQRARSRPQREPLDVRADGAAARKGERLLLGPLRLFPGLRLRPDPERQHRRRRLDDSGRRARSSALLCLVLGGLQAHGQGRRRDRRLRRGLAPEPGDRRSGPVRSTASPPSGHPTIRSAWGSPWSPCGTASSIPARPARTWAAGAVARSATRRS